MRKILLVSLTRLRIFYFGTAGKDDRTASLNFPSRRIQRFHSFPTPLRLCLDDDRPCFPAFGEL